MSTDRPFRFGVLTKGAPTRAAWSDLLARTVGCGFDSLLMPTHTTPQFSVAAALADAAARTELTIGTLVMNNDLAHPALLARDSATLDLLSGGRFELGVGAGWMARDYAQLGLPMDAGRDRVDRLVEAIAVIRCCLAGTEFTHVGEHYRVTGMTGLAAPHRVPLMIGAGGPRMLAVAAEHADIVSLSRNLAAGDTPHEIAADASLAAVEAKVHRLREHLGDRDVELNVLVPRVAIGPHAAETARRRAEATGLSTTDVRDTPEHFFAGSTAELVDRLHERRARTGISYYVVRDQDVAACADLVGALRSVGSRL